VISLVPPEISNGSFGDVKGLDAIDVVNFKID
jgi:hypothetical protein